MKRLLPTMPKRFLAVYALLAALNLAFVVLGFWLNAISLVLVLAFAINGERGWRQHLARMAEIEAEIEADIDRQRRQRGVFERRPQG